VTSAPAGGWPNLIAPLAAHAAREPDREALVLVREDGGSETLGGGALLDAARARSRALAAAGVGRGDVVVLVMGHSRALVTTLLGTLAGGAVPAILAPPSARLDPEFWSRRVRAVAENAAARAVVCDAALRGVLATALAGLRCPVHEAGALDGGAGAPVAAPPGPDDVAVLQYTSGTTGLHKGVAHTHRAMLDFIGAKARKLGVTRADVAVNWVPLHHDLGLVSGFLLPLVCGLRTVLLSPLHWARDPGVLFRAVSEHRGTLCWMPNSALAHCARAVRERDLDGLDLRSWRILSSGGEPVRLATMRRFLDRFVPHGFPREALQVGYGMAENVEAVTHTTTPVRRPPTVDWIDGPAMQTAGVAVPAPPGARGAVPVVSCGTPLPGMAVRVVDATGAARPERHVGEVAIRSPTLLTGGYHGRPDLTRAALRDGWLASGDLGYLAGGELFVCGRKKDVIIVGGQNVHAEDVEALADGVPGVAPGRVVAFGVPDERTATDRIVVVCELRDGGEGPPAHAVERELRRRAARELDVTLGTVAFVPPRWIVKTSSGKLARAANREKWLAAHPAPEPRP